ncbi:MAG: GNAT family N-acetyltransferase [Gorillibacterium sp.]|nr:GNAT family N-acetyltransferase [Gorillibacterium sp.]
MFSYVKSSMADLRPLLNEYAESLSSPIDSFLEDHITDSKFVEIRAGEEISGYYAVYEGKLLTQFFLRSSAQREAQEIFNRVLEESQVDSLFVPTCDELFLSMVVDRDFQMDKQAYFFQDGLVPLPEPGLKEGEEFRLATPGDIEAIRTVCGDFIQHHEPMVAAEQLYVYYKGTLLMGIGVMEKGRIMTDHASVGMFVNEAYRRQGIGRSIILQMKNRSYELGLTPICGCWYYNTLSKLTLESAGMVTKTRLLKVSFEAGTQKRKTTFLNNR